MFCIFRKPFPTLVLTPVVIFCPNWKQPSPPPPVPEVTRLYCLYTMAADNDLEVAAMVEAVSIDGTAQSRTPSPPLLL